MRIFQFSGHALILTLARRHAAREGKGDSTPAPGMLMGTFAIYWRIKLATRADRFKKTQECMVIEKA